MFRPFFLTIGILLATTYALMAQDVKLRAISLLRTDFDQLVHHQQDQGFIKTPLPNMNFSKVFEVKVGTDLVFAIPAPPAQEDGSAFKEVYRLPIGTEIREGILLFVANPQKPEFPYTVFLINADDARFQKGDLFMINMTNQKVGAELGERQVILDPKKVDFVKAPQQLTKDDQYFAYLSTIQDGKKIPLSQGYWPNEKKHRSVVIFFDDKINRCVRCIGIPYRSPKLEEGPKTENAIKS